MIGPGDKTSDQAKTQLRRIEQGENSAEERLIDRQVVTVNDLCKMYLADLDTGLVFGKGGKPKAPGMVVTDIGRSKRHIIPLLGNRRLKNLHKSGAIYKQPLDLMNGRQVSTTCKSQLNGGFVVGCRPAFSGFNRHVGSGPNFIENPKKFVDQ